MITIDHLEVLFDAEEQRDEAVFARLFARHMDEWEQQRARERAAGERARQDRSLTERDAWGAW
jgi:hypothetical protein